MLEVNQWVKRRYEKYDNLQSLNLSLNFCFLNCRTFRFDALPIDLLLTFKPFYELQVYYTITVKLILNAYSLINCILTLHSYMPYIITRHEYKPGLGLGRPRPGLA